ncbi:LuxR C-terminal-related transcriptional regulator [Actinoplanes sp. CA-051413]|uniref:LuxR C-terminal-related transcriptional regulator n=1 Tax=Actinoplanes sp. CA-051413 TaxID=3239899 RepID=UPI003D986645
MIRVLVADDEPLVSAGVSALLNAEPDIEVVAKVSVGRVVESTDAYRPDVVVMDVPPDDIDIIGKVGACGTSRVLVLTVHRSIQIVGEALSAGAAGYLLKQSATEALVGGVRAVAGAGTWLDPVVTADLLIELAGRPVRGQNRSTSTDRLTPREQEVLVLLSRGMSDAEIARQLFISNLTVRTHVGRILTKLGARNRAHAVTTAYQIGLVRIPPPA